MKNREALEAAIEGVLASNTTDHWVDVLEAANVPCGPVYNYQQMFSDPQVQHRGMVVTAEDDELGTVKHIRSPIQHDRHQERRRRCRRAHGRAEARASIMRRCSAASAPAQRRLRLLRQRASSESANARAIASVCAGSTATML